MNQPSNTVDRQSPKHYIRELAVLRRFLQPGMVPMGDSFGWQQPEPDETAYLGEIGLRLFFSGTLGELTDDPALQERIRAKIEELGLLEGDEDDCGMGGQEKYPPTPTSDIEFEVECGQIFAGVEVPLAQLSAKEQALYRMRVLLVNTQGLLRGEGHSWSLHMGEEQAFAAYGTSAARIFGWYTESREASAGLVEFLWQIGIDLEVWCMPEPWYEEGELPDTPPLPWVKARKGAKRLFVLLDNEVTEELELAVAYALHALRESQPAFFRTSLFLADVLRLDQPTLRECNMRLADRLKTLPFLATFADDVSTATSVEQVNATMKKLYAVAPTLGIWLIS